MLLTSSQPTPRAFAVAFTTHLVDGGALEDPADYPIDQFRPVVDNYQERGEERNSSSLPSCPEPATNLAKSRMDFIFRIALVRYPDNCRSPSFTGIGLIKGVHSFPYFAIYPTHGL